MTEPTPAPEPAVGNYLARLPERLRDRAAQVDDCADRTLMLDAVNEIEWLRSEVGRLAPGSYIAPSSSEADQ